MITSDLKDAIRGVLTGIGRHTDDTDLQAAGKRLAGELGKLTNPTISHHCDECGEEVEESCPEHPKALVRSIEASPEPRNNIELMMTLASKQFVKACEAVAQGALDDAEGKLANTIQTLTTALDMLRARKANGDITKPVG